MLTGVAALAALGGGTAFAQQMPGVVVTMPGLAVSAPPQAAPPPPAARPAQPAVQKAAPKAAPKPKPTTTAAIDDGPVVKGGQTIKVLVNDDPITAYEIEMRTRFLAASANVGAQAQENFKRLATSEATNQRFREIVEQIVRENQGKKTREQIIEMIEARKRDFALGLQRQALESARSASAPKFRKDAQEELIEERLKLQEAKKLGIDLPEADVNTLIKNIAERNKQTEAQFAQNLRNMGTDISVMKARFTATLAWREVIRRRFAAQISVNQRDVEKLVAQSAAGANEDTVELQVQRIALSLPAKLDQSAMAQRLAEADGLRRKFGGCKMTGQLAQTLSGARFEDSKFLRPSTISEPTRSLLLSAKDGDMLPPQTSPTGIDIYTVCSRRALKPDEKKREAAQQELQSREFELLARRHLRDLRQDAHIEYR